MTTYRPKKTAKGTMDGNRLKIAVSFDEENFNKISKLAKANNLSFQHQVRKLCEKAMFGVMIND